MFLISIILLRHIVQFYFHISSTVHNSDNHRRPTSIIHNVKYNVVVYGHGAKIATPPWFFFIPSKAFLHLIQRVHCVFNTGILFFRNYRLHQFARNIFIYNLHVKTSLTCDFYIICHMPSSPRNAVNASLAGKTSPFSISV